MTTILTEKSLNGSVLAFEFSDKWQACKYDEQPFYTEIKYQDFKGVDFIALSSNGLLLMEVKYITASNKKSFLRFTADADDDKVKKIKDLLTKTQLQKVIIRSKRPYLVDEISKKIRDTLLGLFASYRKEDTELFSYSQPLFTHNDKPILVLFFLERNTELNQEENFKPLASNLKLAIEQKLSFLGNIQVGVVNSLTLPAALEINILENTPYS
ncbi:MAG: hypothetical protein Q8Q54_15615 [Methylococcales bacterium]|nr:hypothetical protein [Methylococcales bacterium]MDP3840344.1 hypothetical protein [Methylococcales bacterium]